MAGELNGTSVFLEVFNTDTNTWGALGGELTGSPTWNNAFIEITSKATVSFIAFIEGKGRQSIQFAGEFIFNSDVDLQFVRDAANSKSKEMFRFLRDGADVSGEFDQYEALVANMADASPTDDSLTTSFTLNITGSPFKLRRVLNSLLEFVKNAAGDQVYTRTDF